MPFPNKTQFFSGILPRILVAIHLLCLARQVSKESRSEFIISTPEFEKGSNVHVCAMFNVSFTLSQLGKAVRFLNLLLPCQL